MSKSITRRRFLVAGASVLAVGAAALVGGTFAKYVTEKVEYDSALVAAFGATIETGGYLFGNQYVEGTPGTVSEKSQTGATMKEGVTVFSASDALLAPGTASQPVGNDGAFYLKVSGTSEVSVRVTFSTDLVQDVHLGDDYYPVTYTLTQQKDDAEATTKVSTKLSEIASTLEALSAKYVPGTDLGKEIGSLTLTWEWPFNGDDTTASAKDTILGQLAAKTYGEDDYSTGGGGNSNTMASIEIAVAVEQID